MNPKLFSNIRGDIFGGITAAVIALPLALAFGVASGVGPIAGLYGAIAVGFFAAVFGGTDSQVSGPTGPMTVAMAAVVVQYAETPSMAFVIVILAGILQILFGVMRVGRYVSYTPYSVVSGFMSGIGIIIILIQTLPFVGIPTASGGPIGAIAIWPQLLSMLNMDAFLIALATLMVMIFWPSKLSTILPAPLAALFVGTALGYFIFTGSPVIGEVPTGLPKLIIPDISFGLLPGLLAPAMIIALLGSIDSLLTSLVADSITRTRHRSNKELIGQGIGNIVAGFIGGLPGAGATMRTVVNVRAGGRTPLSGAIHAIILLALVLGLGPLAEKIPHAVLAGILMKVGYDIIDWNYLRRIRNAPRDKVVVMLVTMIMTVFVDLITAVGVGLILAAFVTARRAEVFEMEGIETLALDSKRSVLDTQEKKLLKGINDQVAIISLRGRFSYASARELTHSVGIDESGKNAIIFDLSNTVHVDTSAAIAIQDMLENSVENVEHCLVCGLSGETHNTLNVLGSLECIDPANIVDTRSEAIELVAGRLK